MPETLGLSPVYAITDRTVAGIDDHAEIARRLFDVGVRCLQVREKSMPDRSLLSAVEVCARLGRSHEAIVLVNDRVDIARVAGVGVHLGEEDLPAALVDSLRIPGTPLGVSTHSFDAAQQAFGSTEPDYVAFGPVFASGTKPLRSARGLEELARVASIRTKPLVAVGGIDASSLDAVLDAGADSAAMVGGLLRGGRIEENARAVLDAARRRALPGRVYLVGFMGSGKTSVGRRVAERLGIPFVDLDAEIERTSGRTVRALFESEGEPSFREREAMYLAATAALPHAIVSTGGGCYAREENRRGIAGLGISIFLDTPFSVVLARLSNKMDRPLFQTPEQAARLWAERDPFYRMGSVRVALTTETVEEASDRVLAALDARSRARLRNG
jgi:thiamine-phosphate diphosphorylase